MFEKKLTGGIATSLAAGLATVAICSLGAAPAGAAATQSVTRKGTESTFVLKLTGFTPQAALAVEAAADYWANHLSSPVPIVVNLDWKTLGAGQGGQAGPAHYEHDTTGAEPGYAYPKSIANALAGRNLTPAEDDVIGQFNAAASWSLDPTGPVPGKVDLQSVATHELGHGLGLVSDFKLGSGCTSADVACYGSRQGDGSYVYPYDLDRFLATAPAGGHTLLSDPNNSAQLASDLRPSAPGGLYWTGAQGVAAAPGGSVRMYAPSTWEQGSSGGAHLDETTYPAGSANALMTPRLATGEAARDAGPIVLGMMKDLGWTVGSDAPRATTTLLYSTDGGKTWTTHPTVAPGAKVRARVWYDNQDSKVLDAVSVRTALPAGFTLVPASTRVCMSPMTSDPETPEPSLDFCADPKESAVWSGGKLTVSPTNGLKVDAVTAQSTALTRGIFEPGRGFAEFDMIAPEPDRTTDYRQQDGLVGAGAGTEAAGTVTVRARRKPPVPPTSATPAPAPVKHAAQAQPVVPVAIDAGADSSVKADEPGREVLAGLMALGALGLAGGPAARRRLSRASRAATGSGSVR